MAVTYAPRTMTGDGDEGFLGTQLVSRDEMAEAVAQEEFAQSIAEPIDTSSPAGTVNDDPPGEDSALETFAPTTDFVPADLKAATEEQPRPGRKTQSPSSDHTMARAAKGRTPAEFKPPTVPGIQIHEELGRGGMGVVYRAHDEKLNSEIALKTLQRMGPDDLVRFKQEFRGLADIAHPNLASLYELHSDGTTWCLTMELFRGVEFLEYIWSELDAFEDDSEARPTAEAANGARLSEARLNRLYDVLKQLALGLNELHRAGKLHSDIKPSNVFVTTEGRLVLLDFGLIAEITRDEEGRIPKAIQGTPQYMAPEQAACRPLSEASDWYAVGVMLYEVLTGRLPFDGKPVKLMLRKQMEKPMPPIGRQPDVPQDLSDLCMALLEIEPQNRPSAADVLRVLGADALANHILGTASTAKDSVELVGRERQFSLLSQSLTEVIDGATRSVFVHGFSGMGKSVLIHSFLGQLRGSDDTILLEGRCYEQESVPFKALDSLIDSLAFYLSEMPKAESARLIPKDTLPLVRLFPVFGQVPDAAEERGKPTIETADQNELRQRALTALRQILRNLSQQKSVVLYIDDLQWGDDDSSNLLADLVRPPESPSLLLLGSYRREDVETSSALLTLDQAYKKGQELPHRFDLPVDNLSEQDASRLALSLVGRERFNAQKIADRIGKESGGSPFFVWELAQHVEHISDDTSGALGSLELDEVIWSRVTRMPKDTRQLLEAFAVSGRPMNASEVYQSVECPNGPGLLAQLRANSFVRTAERDGATIVETYHDRIRESVVDHLSVTKVRSHNLRIGEAIERGCEFTLEEIDAHIRSTTDFSEPGDSMKLTRRQWQRVFEMASFFDAAGQAERALPYALIAAERAWKQNAFEVAEQQFQIARRGAEIELSRPALRFRIAESLGDVLVRRGKYGRANLHFETARQLAQGNLVQARIDNKLGYLCYKTGEMEKSNTHFHEALAATGTPVPSNLLTQLLAMSKEGTIQILHSCFPRLLTGKRTADTDRGRMDLFRAELHDGLGYPYFFSQGPVPTLWTHLRHMNLSERYPRGLELGRACAYHAVIMTAIPLAGRGARYADRAYEIHEAAGDRLGQGKARSLKSMSLTTAGRFDEAVESGREAARMLDEAGDVWEANMARILVTVPTYYSGELEEACQTARTTLQVGHETGDQMAVAVALYFGSPICPDFAPEGVIQSEVERPRQDPLSSCAIIQARGIELLLREDRPVDAAKTIKDSLDLAWKKMFRNPFIYCGYAWRAEALRTAAEREPEGSSRRKALKAAKKAARTALFITKLYHTSRAQALREMGSILAMQGRNQKARRYFDDSIRVADSQNAKFELAKSQLARGKAGEQFGWPDAEQQAADASQEVARLTAFWNR
jgi:eukaryotic-like serine/threonine-protein kinase